MAIETNATTITIPFFKVGVPAYAGDGELADTIKACRQALDAQQTEEEEK